MNTFPETVNIKRKFQKLAKSTLPKILTNFCRDEDHPAFGSFDRHYWHYKMRDFPSMVLHQGILILDLYARGILNLPNDNIKNKVVFQKWVNAAIEFWKNHQKSNGSYDEYYPNESGFPPTAFSLYATVVVLQSKNTNKELMDKISRSIEFILSKRENEALNQEIIALSACSLAKNLGVKVNEKHLNNRWDKLFSEQHDEGWFNEYNGADTGYLSVACDALWDYYITTNDKRALKALKKAARFIYYMISISGDIPAMVNSRNTDYIVPYGLVNLAKTDPYASSVIRRCFLEVDQHGHFMQHIDERYMLHYVFSSFYRAIPFIDDICEPVENPAGYKWFKKAGIFIMYNPDNSLHINAHKGGIIMKTLRDGTRKYNYGWRGTSKKKLIVTHWQEPESIISMSKSGNYFEINLKMPLRTHKYILPTTRTHILLRIIAKILGRRIIPLLKNYLIFRVNKTNSHYERNIVLQNDHIEINDTFTGNKIENLKQAPRDSIRHVSSAGTFAIDDLQCDLANLLPGKLNNKTLSGK